jgi:hypothetical protein
MTAAPPPLRVAVIGASCAGKTRFAEAKEAP